MSVQLACELPTVPRKRYTWPKPKEPKSLTIAARFECNAGFVLCADRLMSHGTAHELGSFSHYEKKVFELDSFDVAIAICGSGPTGLLKAVVESVLTKNAALKDADGNIDLNGTRQILEEALQDIASKLSAVPEQLSLLLAAAAEDGKQQFLRSDGLVVQSASPIEVLGIGEMSLVRYLTDSVFKPDLDLYQLAALAGFVVYAAKRYCPQYCGGQTDIYMLPKRYSWNTLPVSEEKINALEAILAQKPPECLAGLINEAAAILR